MTRQNWKPLMKAGKKQKEPDKNRKNRLPTIICNYVLKWKMERLIQYFQVPNDCNFASWLHAFLNECWKNWTSCKAERNLRDWHSIVEEAAALHTNMLTLNINRNQLTSSSQSVKFRVRREKPHVTEVLKSEVFALLYILHLPIISLLNKCLLPKPLLQLT